MRLDLAGLRARALFLIVVAGAMRRSDLVGLDVGHVPRTASGLKLLIERSKTDASGEGAGIAIPRGRSEEACLVSSLEWLRVAATSPFSAPLFEMLAVTMTARICPFLSLIAVVT